jgi:hypothetical protein
MHPHREMPSKKRKKHKKEEQPIGRAFDWSRSYRQTRIITPPPNFALDWSPSYRLTRDLTGQFQRAPNPTYELVFFGQAFNGTPVNDPFGTLSDYNNVWHLMYNGAATGPGADLFRVQGLGALLLSFFVGHRGRCSLIEDDEEYCTTYYWPYGRHKCRCSFCTRRL